ncbi:MAG: DUF2807 domain-containing protein, partial [Sphingomonadaceae bacterium]|nr:DUF2807 domain-containing protein [Sphingomonadaceae bacterium]
MKRALVLATFALLAATPAAAERRGFTVTAFDRISVSGPFTVRVTTGRGASAYAEGDADAIERIGVSITGGTLNVRRNVSSWGSFPGEEDDGSAVLHLVTPALERASLGGSGSLSIDRMEAGRVTLVLGGSGTLEVGEIDADRISANIAGDGRMALAGHAEQGTVTMRGTGVLDAAALTVDNLAISLGGQGTATITADATAEVSLTGDGEVT